MTLFQSWPTPGPRPRVTRIAARTWAVVLPAGPLLIHPTHTLALAAALAWTRTKENRA